MSAPRAETEQSGLDRYQLGPLLGGGAVADVYRAVDLRLDRPVAIKLFRSAPDTVARGRFRAEATALARLSHPGLVSVYDAGLYEQRPFLVMRLIEGTTLGDRLLTGPLPPSEVCRMGARLAAAVAHVHEHGIVHRDLKPSNILLDHQGQPYLTDFGIALLGDATRLTGSHQLVGTASYVSPEQAVGGTIGPASDIYTLGLVLLECLTGRTEYQGDALAAIVARLHRPPDIPADIPTDIADLLRAMMADNPDVRPRAVDCARWLEALASNTPARTLPAHTVPAHTPPPAPPVPDPPRAHPPTMTFNMADEPLPARPWYRRRGVVAGVAAGALALTGALLVVTLQSLTPTATGDNPATTPITVPPTTQTTTTQAAPPTSVVLAPPPTTTRHRGHGHGGHGGGGGGGGGG